MKRIFLIFVIYDFHDKLTFDLLFLLFYNIINRLFFFLNYNYNEKLM